MPYFTVDGMEWNFPCTIERVSEVKASSISGQLLNGDYFNDVMGQYLRYTVTLVVPRKQESEYAALYEILTSPVAQHEFVFPYNQGTVNVKGRMERISDRYIKEGNDNLWRQTKFEVLSNKPKRKANLTQAQSSTP